MGRHDRLSPKLLFCVFASRASRMLTCSPALRCPDGLITTQAEIPPEVCGGLSRQEVEPPRQEAALKGAKKELEGRDFLHLLRPDWS